VIAHFDDARRREIDLGHLRSTWSFLGEAAGSVDVGVRRIDVQPGGWSTPAHEHGREEEIFFVLAGSGLSWQGGETYKICAGDCIVFRAHEGAHTVHAFDEGLDVLAFGPREWDENVGFPRLGLSLVGRRAVESVPNVVDGYAIQFVREADVGAPELGEPNERPATIVNVDDLGAAPQLGDRGENLRDLGRAAGSRDTGLKWARLEPGEAGTEPHCHSEEEEVFVVLEGSGVLELWPSPLEREEIDLRTGHVIARPAGSRVAHALRAGAEGMTYLAYGTRRPNDVVYYPCSGKLFFRGLGVFARVEHVDDREGER
jgi:uncharacterized cupin superfamily protein